MNEEQKGIKETIIAVAIVLLLILFMSGYLSFPGSKQTGDQVGNQPAAVGGVANKVADENNQLVVTVTKPGTGEAVKVGDKIAINYRAKFVDGREFDNSYKTNEPLVLTLGAGQVIQGVELGILGSGGNQVGAMKVGETRTIYMAPALAYGEAGAGDGLIPPNTPLVFEIELVSINQ